MQAHGQVGGTAGSELQVRSQDRHTVARRGLMLAAVMPSTAHEAVEGTTEVQAVVRLRHDRDTDLVLRQVGGLVVKDEIEAQEEVEVHTLHHLGVLDSNLVAGLPKEVESCFDADGLAVHDCSRVAEARAARTVESPHDTVVGSGTQESVAVAFAAERTETVVSTEAATTIEIDLVALHRSSVKSHLLETFRATPGV